ncbi:Uncharacterised protein [Yersinia enterocolitica]|uniref:hypothetical protein n=1 Tax=Yersinia enterocolitica TaxID=630 RepID=UPI0005DCC79B|nr:hypothetical protein [Yersinia enterocolitica]CQQ96515.1 Uncharacterised protein [Yersinia enterocolitica]
MININDVYPKDLVTLQKELDYSDVKMAELLGISVKTWVNKRSATTRAIRKQLISPAECEYLMLLAGIYPKYDLIFNPKNQ